MFSISWIIITCSKERSGNEPFGNEPFGNEPFAIIILKREIFRMRGSNEPVKRAIQLSVLKEQIERWYVGQRMKIED